MTPWSECRKREVEGSRRRAWGAPVSTPRGARPSRPFPSRDPLERAETERAPRSPYSEASSTNALGGIRRENEDARPFGGDQMFGMKVPRPRKSWLTKFWSEPPDGVVREMKSNTRPSCMP